MIVFALSVLFVGMWIGVLALLSHLSGWGKLAAVYRAERPPSGTCFSIKTEPGIGYRLVGNEAV